MSTVHNRFELRVALTVAFALLLAQFGAMAHTYSHDAQLSAATARDSIARQSNSGGRDLCGDCLNFAPLLSVSGAPASLPFSVGQGLSPTLQTVGRSQVEFRPLPAFRSRAPPLTH